MSTVTKSEALAKTLTPEELAVTLAAVINCITPIIEERPDAVWGFQCPQQVLIEGDHDETWRAGQSNGEAVTARRILTAINEALQLPTSK